MVHIDKGHAKLMNGVNDWALDNAIHTVKGLIMRRRCEAGCICRLSSMNVLGENSKRPIDYWCVQVVYKWESLDGWAAIPRNYSSKDLVLPAPIQAEPGAVYQVGSSYQPGDRLCADLLVLLPLFLLMLPVCGCTVCRLLQTRITKG